MIRLIYLSTITSIHDGKVPYTRSVQGISCYFGEWTVESDALL